MDNEIILSEHFKLSEFTRSTTAAAKNIDNTPSLTVVSNLQQLCLHILEPLRSYSQTPITINSGYRSRLLNAAVGGVSNSQHTTGEAADIHIPSVEVGRKWFDYIRKNLTFDQLILERASKSSSVWWLHVSFRQNGTNRQYVNDSLIKK